jgi:hypothetical protein
VTLPVARAYLRHACAILSGTGHPACLHPGDNPSYQSLAVWLPGREACVVILSNDEAADIEALLRQLMPVALADDRP